MTQIEPPRSAAYKGSDGHDFRPRKKASLIVTEPPSISGEGPPSGRAKPTGSGYFLNTQTRAASEEWELGTGSGCAGTERSQQPSEEAAFEEAWSPLYCECRAVYL